MKNLFSFRPGTEDIGYVMTALCCLTGIIIGIIAAITFYKLGRYVTSMATLAGVFICAGIGGHVGNNFSQKYYEAEDKK
jgi:ABC-type dipeptide/oligopeptide/nickel transport system permease component